MTKMTFAVGTTVALLTVLATAPSGALAGPCAEQISELSRTLSQNSSLGPVTSGTLTGTTSATGAPQPTMRNTPSDASGEKAGGDAGMREMNRSSSQIATSAQDVRLQQQGKPTVAQGGNINEASGDSMSQAKTQLEHARMLDSQNDQGCVEALGKVRDMMRG